MVGRNPPILWNAISFEDGHELLSMAYGSFGVVRGGRGSLSVHTASQVRVDFFGQKDGLSADEICMLCPEYRLERVSEYIQVGQ